MRVKELIEELIQIKKDYGNLYVVPSDLDIGIEDDKIVIWKEV